MKIIKRASKTVLKLSKKDWLRIAKQAGWFKRVVGQTVAAEDVIEIDGKYYNKDLAERKKK